MFTRTVLTYVGIYTTVAFNVRTFAIDSEAVFLPSTGRTKGLLYSIFVTFCKNFFIQYAKLSGLISSCCFQSQYCAYEFLYCNF